MSKANLNRIHAKNEQLQEEIDAEPSISAAVDGHRNSVHTAAWKLTLLRIHTKTDIFSVGRLIIKTNLKLNL